MRGKTTFKEEEKEDEEDRFNADNISKEVADAQAGHTSHVAGLIYARLMLEQSGAVAEKREWFRASSMDWHEFLGFEEAEHQGRLSQILGKRKHPFQVEMEEEKMQRWKRMRRMDARQKLKQLIGEEAEFRSVQEKAMQAIQSGVSPIVAVMPTSAGKSILFMLPAFVEAGGLTVVVVPLDGLRTNMMWRCQQMGIKCVAWSARQPADAASIVLVTPERAVSEEFGTFLNRMKMSKRLDRVVIDECHVMFNQGLGFRKQLQQMGKLMIAEVQMVLLSATLPPSRKEELWEKMGWVEEPLMFRDQTVRKNIRYQVMDVKSRMRRGVNRKAMEEKEKEVLEELVTGVLTETTGK
jgi:superfamily II DNA helicase RecQ